MNFHQNCGSNIRLSMNNLCARRIGDGYDNGIVYSSRPLKLGEIFQLKIKLIENKWAGSLRFGVTTLDPNLPGQCVFRAATEMLHPQKFTESYWLWTGDKLFYNKKEHKLSLNLHSLVVNDVVGLQIRSNGELHVYQHGFHVAKVASGLPVDKSLYVICDLYGSTKQVVYDTKVGTLQYICGKKILNLVKPQQIEKLDIPKSLKNFLREI